MPESPPPPVLSPDLMHPLLPTPDPQRVKDIIHGILHPPPGSGRCVLTRVDDQDMLRMVENFMDSYEWGG